MYPIKEKKQRELFIELMDSLKKINMDWININSSKEFRTGKTLIETKNDLKKFNIKNIYKSFDRKHKGRKMTKVKSSNYIIDDISFESNYFSKKRIAIYTSIFGYYDKLLEPLFVPDNCDFYVITDLEIEKNSIWNKIEALPEMEKMNNVEKNRYAKMKPYLFFKDYDYSIYIDGNIQIISDLTEYINILNEFGIATHMHNQRNCVYDELLTIKKSKKDSKENLDKHKKYLLDTNMPKNYGLLQCSVIVREHNNPTCKKIMEEWWEEFNAYSKRDQISFPHILYLNNIPIKKIGLLGNNIYKNSSFRIFIHK